MRFLPNDPTAKLSQSIAINNGHSRLFTIGPFHQKSGADAIEVQSRSNLANSSSALSLKAGDALANGKVLIQAEALMGATLKVVNNEQADRRRQVARLAFAVDLVHQFRQCHIAETRDLLHAVPERSSRLTLVLRPATTIERFAMGDFMTPPTVDPMP